MLGRILDLWGLSNALEPVFGFLPDSLSLVGSFFRGRISHPPIKASSGEFLPVFTGQLSAGWSHSVSSAHCGPHLAVMQGANAWWENSDSEAEESARSLAEMSQPGPRCLKGGYVQVSSAGSIRTYQQQHLFIYQQRMTMWDPFAYGL